MLSTSMNTTTGRDAPGRDRWIGVGKSSHADATVAGADAVSDALVGSSPQLLVVFCSDGYDLDALSGAISARAPGVPVIGCSTAGEIASDGPGDASVVVAAFGGPGFSVRTGAAEASGPGGLREAATTAASCIDDVETREHTVLLVLSDGLSGDQQEVVRGAYSVAGAAVPLVGGCAGDDLKMQRTHQLHGGHVLTNSVVAAALSSDAPFGVGVRHGWRKVGAPMLVTASSGTTVTSLDHRPALDVYLERLDAPASVRDDAAAFTRFALTHPLGIDRRSSEEVRFVAEADFDTRALHCIAEVPQGGLAWLMEGDDGSVLEATDAACSDALAALGDNRPLGFLAFDCIARRGVLGEEGISAEVARIAEKAANAPVAGFYTYGEFARTSGVSGFHNQTLVVLAVS